jgi:hypothetical protein
MPGNTRTGDVLEAMILPALDRGGYAHRAQVSIGNRFGRGQHIVDVVAEKDGRQFLVSVKWQQVMGTAEQKVPFEAICLLEALDGSPYSKAYLVLGGERLEAAIVLRRRRPEEISAHCKVEILTLEGFVARANCPALIAHADDNLKDQRAAFEFFSQKYRTQEAFTKGELQGQTRAIGSPPQRTGQSSTSISPNAAPQLLTRSARVVWVAAQSPAASFRPDGVSCKVLNAGASANPARFNQLVTISSGRTSVFTAFSPRSRTGARVSQGPSKPWSR